MPKKIGEEVLPTIEELDEVPRKRVDKDDHLLDSVFEDGDEIYGER